MRAAAFLSALCVVVAAFGVLPCWGREVCEGVMHSRLVGVRLISAQLQDHVRDVSLCRKGYLVGNRLQKPGDDVCSLWLSGHLGRLSLTDRPSRRSFISNNEPLVLGLDYHPLPSVFLSGVAIRDRVDASVDALGETGSFMAHGLLGLVSYKQPRESGRFYTVGQLGYFYHTGEVKSAAYREKGRGGQWVVAGNAGYRIPVSQSASLVPYVRLSSSQIKMRISSMTLGGIGSKLAPGFSPLSRGQTALTLAASFDKTYRTNSGLSLLSDSATFDAYLGYTYLFDRQVVSGRSLVASGVGATVRPSKAFNIFLRGDFEVAEKHVANLVSVGLGYRW